VSGRSIGESGGDGTLGGATNATLTNRSRRKLIQRTNTVRDNPNATHGTASFSSAPLLRGFVDGDFSNGIRHFIDVSSKCFAVTSCQKLLVIGTETCLVFYDAKTFTEIHQIPVSTMISALRLIESPVVMDQKNSNHFFLAAADLSATIRLYEIDIDILESQGPTLIYTTTTTKRQQPKEDQQTQQPAQIRCVDLVLCEFSEGKGELGLVLVAGDTIGRLRLVEFAATSRYTTGTSTTASLQFTLLSSQCIEYDEKILSVSLQKHGYLAVSFGSGWIRVGILARSVAIGTEDEYTDSLSTVFQVQRQGPVRCVRWLNDQYLAAGGYDKCVVIFDQSQRFAISRILHLQGTVRLDG
jgi:hypothetical protein